jgi:hypothetical protein
VLNMLILGVPSDAFGVGFFWNQMEIGYQIRLINQSNWLNFTDQISFQNFHCTKTVPIRFLPIFFLKMDMMGTFRIF